jgi:hypothetical protein
MARSGPVRSRQVFLFLALSGALGLAACGSSSSSQQVKCDQSSAYTLIRKLPVATNPGAFLSSDQILCMNLTGSGRQDLVATVWDAMNHGAHYWAAWRNAGSKWVLIAFSGNCCSIEPHKFGMGLTVKQTAASGQFVVSQPIYRPKDPACCPSGGIVMARWAWSRGAIRVAGRS